eukprot:IDg1098t1
MGHESPLESTVAAMRLKDINDLTWETVTADLIQESKKIKGSKNKQQHKHSKKPNADFSSNPTTGKRIERKHAFKELGSSSCDKCSFCGKTGHKCDDWFLNPNSPKCRLPEQAMNCHQKQAPCRRARKIMNPKTFIDSGASVSMFKDKSDADSQSYEQGSQTKFSLPREIAKQSALDPEISLWHAVVLNIPNFEVNDEDVLLIANRDVQTGLYALKNPIKDKRALATRSELSSVKGKHTSVPSVSYGKGNKKSFASSFESANYAREIVHSDLAGPMPISIHGSKYACTFTDQYTRFTHMAGIRSKDQTARAVEDYKELTHVKRYFKNGIERLHSDGGLEYSNINVPKHTRTTPYTPEHNPFSEKMNRTLLEPVRSLLEQAGLSGRYWEYAMCYVVSEICKTFGCTAFVYEQEPKSKVHARAAPSIMLGCNDNGIYTVERLTDGKIIDSVHVTVDEYSFPALDRSSSSSSECSERDEIFSSNSSTSSMALSSSRESLPEADNICAHSNAQENSNELEAKEPFTHSNEQDSLDELELDFTNYEQLEVEKRRSSRERKAPDFYTYSKAANGQMHGRHHTVNGAKVLPSHIILRIKRDEKGHPTRFKARVVAGGNYQVRGKDFESVYAPVVDFTAVLTVLGLGRMFKWIAKHVDITTAFLNGDIDRDIHIAHPSNAPADLSSNIYYKLLKSLYGLKQAPLQWSIKLLDALLNKLNYRQFTSDGAVFMRTSENDFSLILVYVDDIIFVSKSEEVLEVAIEELLNIFSGKNNGKLTWYLGIHVKNSQGSQSLSLYAYVEQILNEYGLINITAYDTPMIASFYADLDAHGDEEVISQEPYRSMIGSLMFLSNRTRPDISTAVGILAQYVKKPTKYLMRSIKRVFGYLKHTISFGIVQKPSERISIQFHCDSDFAAERSERKSRTGWRMLPGDQMVSPLPKRVGVHREHSDETVQRQCAAQSWAENLKA